MVTSSAVVGSSAMISAGSFAIAIAISLAVFGTNLFGDALRDILDPRQRG